MMVCGQKMVQPSLLSSQVMDGKTVHQIYGTRQCMYLRPSVYLRGNRTSNPSPPEQVTPTIPERIPCCECYVCMHVCRK